MNNLEKGITLTRLLRKITNSVLNQNILKKKILRFKVELFAW